MKEADNWKKNLIVLGISQFFYRAGTRSLIPFLPLFIQDLGKASLGTTAIWSGWIFAAPFIVSFFATPFWGSFGDRFGRKLMTLLAVFGFAVSQLLMGISANLTQLLLFASLQEVMGGFYPAAVSLTASNTPKDKTAHAFGLLQFSNGAGNVVGPIIGGVLAELIGYREVFFIIAGTVAICGFAILFFINGKKYTVEKHSYHSLIKNLKYLFKTKILFACGLFLLIYSLSVSVIRPTFSLFIGELNSTAHIPSIVGIILGIYGGTSALASAFFGKLSDKKSLHSILLFAVITASATSILTAVISSIAILIILLGVGGFALGLMLPLINTLISNNTEPDRKAGVFGIGSSFQVVGNLVGSVTAGYLVSMFGLSLPFISAGVLFLFVIPISKFALSESQKSISK